MFHDAISIFIFKATEKKIVSSGLFKLGRSLCVIFFLTITFVA